MRKIELKTRGRSEPSQPGLPWGPIHFGVKSPGNLGRPQARKCAMILPIPGGRLNLYKVIACGGLPAFLWTSPKGLVAFVSWQALCRLLSRDFLRESARPVGAKDKEREDVLMKGGGFCVSVAS